MADTVTGPTILQENDARVVVKLVQQSDGTGKSTVGTVGNTVESDKYPA